MNQVFLQIVCYLAELFRQIAFPFYSIYNNFNGALIKGLNMSNFLVTQEQNEVIFFIYPVNSDRICKSFKQIIAKHVIKFC